MEGGSHNAAEEEIDASGYQEGASSFYSQSFKAQLAANQLLTGFDTKDCTLNASVL